MAGTAVTVLAQQTDTAAPSGNVWTLRQCIEYALANNLTVQRSTYNMQSSDIDRDQALYNLLPTLNGSVNYGYNWGRSIDPVTYQYTTRQLSSLSPSANASVTLFNGLRLQHTVRQSSLSYKASEQDLLKAKNDVMLNIALLYINVVFNKEQLENAKFQVKSSQVQLDRITKQVAAGALAKSEQLNQEAQVATNELTVIQRENTLNLSILQLKQALQIPAENQLDVEVPEIGVEDLLLEQSRDEIYAIARGAMPEIRSAEYRVQSSYFAVKAARGNLYPRLSLGASINSNYSSASDVERFIPDGGSNQTVEPVGYVEGSNAKVVKDITVPTGNVENGYGYRAQLKDNIYRSAGLTLTVPIFNGFSARNNIRRAAINYEVSKITQKETENTLRQTIETAYNDALAASKTFSASQRQVAAREEAYRMMSQRFEAGSSNSIDYQVSENDLYRAKSDLTRAKYDFIFRKKVLDFYLGKQLEF